MSTTRRYRDEKTKQLVEYAACDAEKCKTRSQFHCSRCGKDYCFNHIYRPTVAWRKVTLYGEHYYCRDCVEAIVLAYADEHPEEGPR